MSIQSILKLLKALLLMAAVLPEILLASDISSLNGTAICIRFDQDLDPIQYAIPGNYKLQSTNSEVVSVLKGPENRTVILGLSQPILGENPFLVTVTNRVFAGSGAGSISLTGYVQVFFNVTNLPFIPVSPTSAELFTMRNREYHIFDSQTTNKSSGMRFYYGANPLPVTFNTFKVPAIAPGTTAALLMTDGLSSTSRFLGLFITRSNSSPDTLNVETRLGSAAGYSAWTTSSVQTVAISNGSIFHLDRNFRKFSAYVTSTNDTRSPLIASVTPDPPFPTTVYYGVASGIESSGVTQSLDVLITDFQSLHGDPPPPPVLRISRWALVPGAGGNAFQIFFTTNYTDVTLDQATFLRTASTNWTPQALTPDLTNFSFTVPIIPGQNGFFRLRSNYPENGS